MFSIATYRPNQVFATNPPTPYNNPLLFHECEFVCSVLGRYFKTTRLPARVSIKFSVLGVSHLVCTICAFT